MHTQSRLAMKWLPLLLVCMIGCGPSKKAIFLDPNFHQSEIDRITLLPAIDARIDTSLVVDTHGQIRERVMDHLEGKDYQCTLSESIGDVGQITEDLLKSGDSSWIKRLGPPEARWTMVLMLIDVSSEMSVGSSGNAEVAGFLFDKEKGIILWRDKGIGKAGQSGLAGMFFKGNMDEQAIREAMEDLMSTFPERSKQ